jgi:hypothetical protein
VTEREETGIDLLLSEPEIVAWLEPAERSDAEHLDDAVELSAADG